MERNNELRRMKTIVAITFVFIMMVCSCRKTMPSGFWQSFKAEYLTENVSNQGPRGGHLAMYWRAASPEIFQSEQVVAYAKKNGWHFVDSMQIGISTLNKWYNIKRPIFPLSYEGFDHLASSKYSTYEDFPRWITANSKVYSFKTNWVSIKPGTNETNNVNGFVLLNDDGSEMSVYHLWGE